MRFLFFILLTPFFFRSIYAQNPGIERHTQAEEGKWYTDKIGERYYFYSPDGTPTYILGINHIDADTDEEKLAVKGNLKKWKYNCGGYGIPDWLLEDFPGFVHVSLHDAVHWLPSDHFCFVDVFSDVYEDRVREAIRGATESKKDNTNVIGYSLTDTPRYDLDIIRERRGDDWVSYIRRLPEDAPGKQEYVSFLKERYDNDFVSFKKDYRLEKVQSFDDLYDYKFEYLELTRPAIRQDDEAFIFKIAERIYQLTKKYFDQYDPGALLLSEKFKMHDHPEEILKLAGKYFDIISIQPGPTKGPDAGQGPDESTFDASYWEYIYHISGKPVFITDHGFAFYTPEYPRTLWHQFHSEEKAADFYDWYLKQAIKEPYIIGYMKCQYRDRYDPLRTLLKQGVIKQNGTPYKHLEQQIIRTNTEIMRHFDQ